MNIPHFFVITYKIFAFTCYVDVSQNLAVCSTNHKSTSVTSLHFIEPVFKFFLRAFQKTGRLKKMIIQINSQITNFRKTRKFKFFKYKIFIFDFSNTFHTTNFICTSLSKSVFKESLLCFTIVGIQGDCKTAYFFVPPFGSCLFKHFLVNQNPVFFYSTVSHKRTESSLITKKIKGITPRFKTAEKPHHLVIFKRYNSKSIFCKKFHHRN